MLAVLSPLACTDLRAPYRELLVATDASLESMAAVRAYVSEPVSRELGRTSLTKGRWTALLGPHSAWERQHGILSAESEIEEPYNCHPFWELCARGLNFRESWRCSVTATRHINVLEMRAFLKEERRLCMQCKPGRQVFGLDSQVCLGALVKGRSASPALNCMLQRELCNPLGCGIFGHYLYFPSKYNRADGPTRKSDPAPPDVELPEWFWGEETEFLAGLDQWLESVGVDEEVSLPFDALTITS